MLSEIKKLSKHTIIYGSGTLISKSVGFFLIPLYTHYLLPAEYGVLELLDLTVFILFAIFGLGMEQSLLRYLNIADDEIEKKKIISSSVLLWNLWGVMFLLILVPFKPALSDVIFGTKKYEYFLLISFINVYLVSSIGIVKTVLRVYQKSILFTAISLSTTLVSVFLNIYFIAILKIGIKGYLYSTLISSSLTAILLNIYIIKKVGVNLNFSIFRKMVKYGLPFVPTMILAFVLNWSDRFILRIYCDMETIGLYALGYKIGMIVVFLVVVPFELVWSSYIFEVSKREDAKNIYSTIATYYFFITCLLGVTLAILSRELISIMADSSYADSYKVVPLIALSMVFMSSNKMFNIGLLIKGKSTYFPLIQGVTASVNILLNFILIPGFGMIGAAIATAISSLVYAVILLYCSQRWYHIKFEFFRILKILFAALFVFGISQFIVTERMLFDILIKSYVVVTFPLILYLAKFYNKREIDYVTNNLRSIF